MASRILVVEDEPELRHAITVRLTAAGFACDTAGNGNEGLARVEQQRPDLIIADLVMPEMDGQEMVRRLQEQAATASIPVIVLTALPEHARVRWAKELARARVLEKPFDSTMLLTTVRELLPPGGTLHG